MDHILSLEGQDLTRLQDQVFPKILSGETILFLGAGASVTDEKKYLSSEIIDYYSDHKGINLNTNDLIDFVDTLSAKKSFDRNEFDQYVVSILRKLKTSPIHKAIASTRWKEIITTNYDLLVEKAFEEVYGTINEAAKCKAVRKLHEYNYRPANDEVKYVKLNGCISDFGKYPLVFSSKDFENSNKYYKTVLKSLENLSYQVNFLSVGYSFKDVFAKRLLDKFDKFNYRVRRWMISVDPFAETDRLDFFAENKICIIKTSGKQFFESYKQWESENSRNLDKRSKIIFKSPQNKVVPISTIVKRRISGNMIQLVQGNSFSKISPLDFYAGAEPNFQVIQDNLDVVKKNSIEQAMLKIKQLLADDKPLIPTLLLEGAFGIGKTTLTYRVIENLLFELEDGCVAFEIVNPDNLNIPDLENIFSNCNAQNIILFFNGVELDSAFKGLLRFRNRLSVEQLNGYNLIVLASMRENILAKFLKENQYQNFHQLRIDSVFSEGEADDLVTKLDKAHLLSYRDAKEKELLIRKVVKECQGDTLVSLISLVSEGTHYEIIRDAYNEINKDAQQVFLFTSLLYRFGIPMPAGLLRRLIDMSWDDFVRDIIPYDFKNFIIKEEKSFPGTDPDLFYKARHPLISEQLIKIFLLDEDARFQKYEFMLRRLSLSSQSATLAINLLKTLRHYKDLSEDKIDHLFDVCGEIFHEDAQFNLHYAINLQHRRQEKFLKKALQRITYAESFLEYRNHRLIHRKAVISAALAKIILNREENKPKEVFKYVEQARNAFEIKLILDPFSSYSYVDYFSFELWCMDNFSYDEMENIRRKIRLQELLDRAEKSVFDNLDKIANLRTTFQNRFKERSYLEQQKYEQYLESLCEDKTKKPYGLVLKYYNSYNDENKIHRLIPDLEEFLHFNEVARILFIQYGRNLYTLENRIKFMNLVKKHVFLKDKEAIRYHYYWYMHEAYNSHFSSAWEYIGEMKSQFGFLNPEIKETWKDIDGTDKVFPATIRYRKAKIQVKVPELDLIFDLKVKGGKNLNLSENTKCSVKLYFYLFGIRADIVHIQK